MHPCAGEGFQLAGETKAKEMREVGQSVKLWRRNEMRPCADEGFRFAGETKAKRMPVELKRRGCERAAGKIMERECDAPVC